MFKRILKGLAISFGAGLILRAGTSRRSGKQPLGVDPLMRRLDEVELRMGNIERAAPTPAAGSGEVAAMRELVENLDRRTTEQIAMVCQRLDELQSHLPRFIDVKIIARVREMEDRLKADILESRERTLEKFVASVETKMLEGIAGVESSLASQSREIGELRERLGQTDQNLSKILATVERLAPTGSFQVQRFETVSNGH